MEIHDKSKNGKVLVLENGSLASYELTADSIILITDGMKVKDGDSIAKIPKESLKLKILPVDYLELQNYLKLENQKIMQ